MAKSLPKSTFPGIFAIVVISVLIVGAAQQSAAEKNMSIPDWVKNNAKWWADGQIAEVDFISAIQYLINEGVIRITPQITEVVAVSSSLNPSDSADSLVVTFWAEGVDSEKNTFYTFSYFVHYPQTMANSRYRTVQGSAVVLEDYYVQPTFILESVPSKDKKPLYEFMNEYIKKSGDADLRIHAQVDIVAGDGSIILTWDYRQCDIEGYWTYVDDWKEYYKYIPGNESEIHERFQFECRGFSLLVP